MSTRYFFNTNNSIVSKAFVLCDMLQTHLNHIASSFEDRAVVAMALSAATMEIAVDGVTVWSTENNTDDELTMEFVLEAYNGRQNMLRNFPYYH